MPTTNSATYSEYYVLSPFNTTTGAYTIESSGSITSTLCDDAIVTVVSNCEGSLTANGTEATSESARWFTDGIDSGPVTYVGQVNGDPIFIFNGSYYLLSNTSGLNGSGTASFTSYTYCYLRGTQIATPAGECAVESLNIGDLVLTHDGRSVPVRWIGRQTMTPLLARLENDMPIRIDAGALGEGLPLRDLYLSPGHAVLVDGVLVNASALVNGVSIVQMQQWDGEIVYYHIETEAHELLLAEGTPAESFLDDGQGGSQRFDNAAEYAARLDAGTVQPMPIPRACCRRQVAMHTRRRLLALAEAGQVVAA